MERRAQAAESLMARSSGQAALDHAIQAAELYMRAATEARTKPDKTRFRHKCQELIARAERLKAASKNPSSASVTGSDSTHSSSTVTSSLPPSTQESLLRRTSRLHGNEFPPWKSDPMENEFGLEPGASPYTDNAVLALSPRQAATSDGWKRPRDLFSTGDEVNNEDFMDSRQGCDLIQDMTTDCSVVASLCAAMRVLTGKHQVLSSIFYPFDHAKGLPRYSKSGRYILRLHFNGCSRRVVVDDRLPASLTDRTLFVVDRCNPRLIWPALLEKAYLKVRGGYDFPGSNSGTDLWVLTGWIPEQLFLQREDLEIDATWERIKAGHDADDVVVTLGTGRISEEEEHIQGLIGEHDYAVMDFDEGQGVRRLLVKNPWRNGPVWKGGSSSSSISDIRSNRWSDNGNEIAIDYHKNPATAGSFWMSLEDVVQNFESMYLNWNPALLPYRQDHHFLWRIPPNALSPSLVHNPQYSLQCSSEGPVWILVSRHFVDAELDIARMRTDSMAAVSRQLGFMSILIFDNGGDRVQVSDGDIYRGPYVDSPQTLARLDAVPGKRYTIVLDQHEFPLPDYTLTLSLFSQAPLIVKEAADAMAYSKEVAGTWNRRTAGGNPGCPTYYTNPQFKLSLNHASPLSILLSTSNSDAHVHVDLIWAEGKRATTVKIRDLAGSSGEYRRGCAVATIPHLDAGVYTLVCSTFDAGQLADFILRVTSMTPVTIEPVPADVAGRLRTPLPPLPLLHGEEVRRAPLSVSWLTRASIVARCAVAAGTEKSGRHASALMVRISVVHGWDPERKEIAVSGDGEFQEPKTALRTPEFDMEPERIHREGMWLVIESIGSHNLTQGIDMELHSDASVHVGAWEIV